MQRGVGTIGGPDRSGLDPPDRSRRGSSRLRRDEGIRTDWCFVRCTGDTLRMADGSTSDVIDIKYIK